MEKIQSNMKSPNRCGKMQVYATKTTEVSKEKYSKKTKPVQSLALKDGSAYNIFIQNT